MGIFLGLKWPINSAILHAIFANRILIKIKKRQSYNKAGSLKCGKLDIELGDSLQN